MGHARALLGLESAPAMEKLARRTVAQDLSVRKVEELVRRERTTGDAEAKPAGASAPTASARDLAMRLTRALGTRVGVVEAGPGSGQIVIHYNSLDELDGLLERLMPQR